MTKLQLYRCAPLAQKEPMVHFLQFSAHLYKFFCNPHYLRPLILKPSHVNQDLKSNL